MRGRIRSIYVALPKSRSEILAWILVSNGVLPVLIAGLTWVAVNQTSSSGAILVGCTIVSQALLQVWPMTGHVGGRKSKAQIEIEALNPNLRGITAYSGFDIEKARDRLGKIALDYEINFPHPGNTIGWLEGLTISRVYLSLEWCIVICAVIGTVVWAYVPE